MSNPVQAPKKVVRSRDYRTVFANGLRFRIGDNDAGLTFLVETDDEAGAIIYEDQVQVVMTPRTLKILQMVVAHGLSELEKVVGPITLDPTKQAEIEKAMTVSQIRPNS